MFDSYSDDQEVVRTVGDLKSFASQNWWGGYMIGVVSVIAFLVLLAGIGLYLHI